MYCDCKSVNILIVILYYNFAKFCDQEELSKVYKGFFCVVSYDYMWIHNDLNFEKKVYQVYYVPLKLLW